MKIFAYRGMRVAVLSNDHCPAHVHVMGNDWEARFQFSFVQDKVWLWDVLHGKPRASTLEAVRRFMLTPANLRVVRNDWSTVQTTLKLCLENQMWDDRIDEVVPPKNAAQHAVTITDAAYDQDRNVTVLHLAGPPNTVEIEL